MRPPLALRTRLTLAFAGALTGVFLLFSAVILGLLFLEAHEVNADPGWRRDVLQVVISVSIALPFGVVGAAFLGSWMARRALAPLEEASNQAERARVSVLEMQLPVTGRDVEWDRLARTLNRLLGEGRSAMARIQSFTGDAAHELRTPIFSILGLSDVMLRREHTQPELHAALVTVREEALRLSQAVDSLLVLARLDEGGLPESARSSVELRALVQSAHRRLLARPLSTERPHLALELEGESAQVLVDASLVSRALDNLLQNAEQAGARNVVVRMNLADTQARLELADDGPGIPDTLLPRLFQRFARDARNSKDGHGLGLAVSRAIAVAHGGSLEHVPSAAGASFRLLLPVASPRKN